jgi:hypothetical protein
MLAIGSLAGEGGAAPAKSGEPAAIPGRASSQAGPHAHLGVVGDRSGGGEVAGGEVQRRPAAVAAAAREILARERNGWQQANA